MFRATCIAYSEQVSTSVRIFSRTRVHIRCVDQLTSRSRDKKCAQTSCGWCVLKYEERTPNIYRSASKFMDREVEHERMDKEIHRLEI